MDGSAENGTNGGRRLWLALAGIFVLAFAIAFGLAWLLLNPAAPAKETGQPEDRVHRVTAAEAEAFARAVGRGDFSAMRDIGKSIFRRGADATAAVGPLADHAASSLPPYRVYALHHEAMDGKILRVLLTLDDDDRVVSFVAEETSVIQ
ncbi:MAG: hypothetical protein LBE84_08735 [Planctomycetota bacterium]|jgi:hypothetical protein|nr:hypothetical protein [Planctomycetota bacterium]